MVLGVAFSLGAGGGGAGLGGTLSNAVPVIAGLAMILLSPICYTLNAPLISVVLAIVGWAVLIGAASKIEGN